MVTTSGESLHQVTVGKPRPPRVVIIGGGIAGLAAAHYLAQSSTPVQVSLLEREPQLGGKLRTERIDDFLLEAGPDSFLSAKPRGVGLATELGLADQLQSPIPRRHRAFVLSRGRLHPLPEGLSGLVPTRLRPIFASSLLSLPGKLRFAADLVLPPRPAGDDESLAAFVRRRLGTDAYDRLVEPLMAGIYAGDGDRLSLAATFPQLRAGELAHGGLIRGVLANAASTASPGRARPGFLAPVGGLGDLVSALTQRLVAVGVDLRAGLAATKLRRAPLDQSSRYQVELASGSHLEADAIVLAAPAYVAGELLKDLDAGLARELLGIPHGSTAIVNVAFRRDQVAHDLDGHGYIIPRIENRPILAATWVSQKWAGRAPAGFVLLRVFLGRFGQEDVLTRSDSELIGLARTELAATVGAFGKPVLAEVRRWPWGMPQYVLGHLERLERIDAGVGRHPGLALAGNAYRGVGIPDVIGSGEAAARAVLNQVTAPAR